MTEPQLSPREAAALNPLVLAFLGDGVYSLLARELLVAGQDAKVGALHSQSAAMVNAASQAAGYDKIKDILTEDEAAVFRRARNAHASHTPKNMSERDYHAATGLEAVFGYLHLCGQEARLRSLFAVIQSVSQP